VAQKEAKNVFTWGFSTSTDLFEGSKAVKVYNKQKIIATNKTRFD
jgi:hypothetical protein